MYDTFVFKATSLGVDIFDVITEALMAFVIYNGGINSVTTTINTGYLMLATTNSGIWKMPLSTISGVGNLTDKISAYKMYPDISNNYVNYVHGSGNYLCVATISGAHIFDLTTNSGIYSNTSIAPEKCYQLSDRTSYYIYDNKATTVYNDDSTYLYESGDGIIPTVSGINDIYVVFGTNNLILLATTDGVVVIEESKGNESNSLFKYFYIEE